MLLAMRLASSRGPALARMFALIEGQSSVQISSRVLHEIGLGLLAAKAVGLALERRIDRAIRLYVFVVGKAPGTLVVELASCGISRDEGVGPSAA